MAYDLTAEERETIITTNDEMSTWHIYTGQKKIMTKIEKMGIEPYKVDEIEDKIVAKYYKDVPFGNVKLSKKKQVNLSEDQKKALAERLAKARNKNIE